MIVMSFLKEEFQTLQEAYTVILTYSHTQTHTYFSILNGE